MPPLHLTGRKYVRAAESRLDAVELLVRSGFNFEAIYLAGYVVECSLKAVLLAHTPLSHQESLARRRFAGRAGHNLDLLRKELLRHQVPIPPEIVAHLVRVAQWSTDLRYETGIIATGSAESFVRSATAVLEWAKRST